MRQKKGADGGKGGMRVRSCFEWVKVSFPKLSVQCTLTLKARFNPLAKKPPNGAISDAKVANTSE